MKLFERILVLVGMTMVLLVTETLGISQSNFDAIADDGSLDVNVSTDYLDDGVDSYWAIAEGADDAVFTMVLEYTAARGRTIFGIYEYEQPGRKVPVFAPADTPGTRRTLQIFGDGSVVVDGNDSGLDFAANAFGFYLDASEWEVCGLFYSDTQYNSDGVDHMAGYRGPNPAEAVTMSGVSTEFGGTDVLMAWEDWEGSGDRDYLDLIVLIENVEPHGGTPVGQSVPPWIDPYVDTQSNQGSGSTSVPEGGTTATLLTISVASVFVRKRKAAGRTR